MQIAFINLLFLLIVYIVVAVILRYKIETSDTLDNPFYNIHVKNNTVGLNKSISINIPVFISNEVPYNIYKYPFVYNKEYNHECLSGYIDYYTLKCVPLNICNYYGVIATSKEMFYNTPDCTNISSIDYIGVCIINRYMYVNKCITWTNIDLVTPLCVGNINDEAEYFDEQGYIEYEGSYIQSNILVYPTNPNLVSRFSILIALNENISYSDSTQIAQFIVYQINSINLIETIPVYLNKHSYINNTVYGYANVVLYNYNNTLNTVAITSLNIYPLFEEMVTPTETIHIHIMPYTCDKTTAIRLNNPSILSTPSPPSPTPSPSPSLPIINISDVYTSTDHIILKPIIPLPTFAGAKDVNIQCNGNISNIYYSSILEEKNENTSVYIYVDTPCTSAYYVSQIGNTNTLKRMSSNYLHHGKTWFMVDADSIYNIQMCAISQSIDCQFVFGYSYSVPSVFNTVDVSDDSYEDVKIYYMSILPVSRAVGALESNFTYSTGLYEKTQNINDYMVYETIFSQHVYMYDIKVGYYISNQYTSSQNVAVIYSTLSPNKYTSIYNPSNFMGTSIDSQLVSLSYPVSTRYFTYLSPDDILNTGVSVQSKLLYSTNSIPYSKENNNLVYGLGNFTYSDSGNTGEDVIYSTYFGMNIILYHSYTVQYFYPIVYF